MLKLHQLVPARLKPVICQTVNRLLRHYNLMSAKFSYAQAGEDMILDFLFQDIKRPVRSYLDIGVNHPIRGNNSYFFYLNGCRGVCVEANPLLIDEIKQTRPGDTVLNVGVTAGGESMLEFYYFPQNTGISTFDRNAALERGRALGLTYSVLTVPTLSLNRIFEEHIHGELDLLSIDIEDFDLPVLTSLDWARFVINVIVIESCKFSNNHVRPKDRAIIDLVVSHGYVVYADTYINTILVREEWFRQI